MKMDVNGTHTAPSTRAIKTTNKREALALLEECLESSIYLSAGIKKVGEEYCVEVDAYLEYLHGNQAKP